MSPRWHGGTDLHTLSVDFNLIVYSHRSTNFLLYTANLFVGLVDVRIPVCVCISYVRIGCACTVTKIQSLISLASFDVRHRRSFEFRQRGYQHSLGMVTYHVCVVEI